MPSYPNARPDLRTEVERIRAYTALHAALRACHHFCFDFRLGAFHRATYIVMGLNPGETDDDRAIAGGPHEESSLVDYRAGRDSASRARWFNTCRNILSTDQIALSELCFWSSANLPALVERIGPLEGSPHMAFCRELNERLIAFHRPRAIVLPGLQLLPLAEGLYGLKHVASIPNAKGHRLIEHFERDGTPWVFTKHWSGAFGFSETEKGVIRDYLHRLGADAGRVRMTLPLGTGAGRAGLDTTEGALRFWSILFGLLRSRPRKRREKPVRRTKVIAKNRQRRRT